jgi:hypothetical protein
MAIAKESERRIHPRIYKPMPLTVRGADFTFDTITDNLSAGGLLSHSLRKLTVGDTLEFRIQLSIAGSNPVEKPDLSAKGIVTRIRSLDKGTHEFAVKFIHTKLF